MKPSETLVAYIEAEIIPRYAAFDRAHDERHVRTVIERSLALAGQLGADADMAYTVAAYHDTGLTAGRERHHTVSGEIRASAGAPPRNLYGRIVAEADRLIEPMTIIRRTVQYGLAHYPELDREGHYARCMEHLQHKYGDGGYLRLWLAESENARRLEELRALLRREEPVREAFERIFDEETAR